MPDPKPDALEPSGKPGAVTKAPTGDLVARGLADLGALQSARDEVVVFPDAALEAAVREAVGQPDGPLTKRAVERLETLDVRELVGRPIRDLNGLEYCVNLSALGIGWAWVGNLAPLAGLTQLTSLLIQELHGIGDLEPLVGLTKLTKLHLYAESIGDLTPLTRLTQLTDLDLSGISGSNLKPLSGLTRLTTLRLAGYRINDLTPLRDLTQLTELFLTEKSNRLKGQLRDLTPLRDLTQLTVLFLGGNAISDLTPLKDLIRLRALYLDYNQITDLTPLAGLAHLSTLKVWENPLNPEAKRWYQEWQARHPSDD